MKRHCSNHTLLANDSNATLLPEQDLEQVFIGNQCECFNNRLKNSSVLSVSGHPQGTRNYTHTNINRFFTTRNTRNKTSPNNILRLNKDVLKRTGKPWTHNTARTRKLNRNCVRTPQTTATALAPRLTKRSRIY